MTAGPELWIAHFYDASGAELAAAKIEAADGEDALDEALAIFMQEVPHAASFQMKEWFPF